MIKPNKFIYFFLPGKMVRRDVKSRSGGVLPTEITRDIRDYVEPLQGVAESSFFSLRGSPTLSRVESQSIYNSCVAHAITTAIESYAKVNGWPHYFELSRMHLWNEARKLSGTYPKNQGCYIRDGWKAAQKEGIAIEQLFPYGVGSYNKEPGVQARIFRHWYPDFKYYWIHQVDKDGKYAAIKSVLTEKRVPIVFSAELPKSFLKAKSEDYKPDYKEEVALNHAMLIVGFDDQFNRIQIMNSWDRTWGDGGFLWVDKNWLLSKVENLSYPWK